MLTPAKTYEDVYNKFEWQIPEFYNIGIDICDKWAHQRFRLALVYENEKGQVEKYTFWDLKNLSNKLANGLKALGIGIGDRPLRPQLAELLQVQLGLRKDLLDLLVLRRRVCSR